MNFLKNWVTLVLSLFISTTVVSQSPSSVSTGYYFNYDVQTSLRQASLLRSGELVYKFVLPLPNGEFIEFIGEENEVLPSMLRRRYPDVWSMTIKAADRPEIYGRLTIGGSKILASIQTPEGLVTINPSFDRPDTFVAFYGNYHPEKEEFIVNADCEQHPGDMRKQRARTFGASRLRSGSGFSIGGTLRTYRMAIVVTGEFYQANGNNNTDVLAAISFGVNGINMIYENELSATFTLVSDPFLYTDPNTDPFDPSISRTIQAADAVGTNFNSADYDIGHVLNDGGNIWPGGGVARLRVVCVSSGSFGNTGPDKGAGWSGSFSTTNSWIQIFAHEVGHQFGATHTFNGTGNSCTGTAISDTTAYEIGSGSTIMSYEGICQDDNNVPGRGATDNYFHAHTLEQISTYIDATTCETESNSSNDAPSVDATPNNATYYIPISTPFELEGQAVDFMQSELTYCWEQLDEDGAGSPTQGLLGAAAGANALAPLFRSFAPDTSSTRMFPSLANILAGNNTGVTFEALPSVARTLNFALTVRDNQAGGGGVSCDMMSINVENTGGAFAITSQNSAISYVANGSNMFTITWDVAGTTGGNINAANVDIYFSTDGGENFPYKLAESIPNNGTTTLLVPDLPTILGRIKVKASDNIFFDINNDNIIITSTCAPEAGLISPDGDCLEPVGDPNLDLNLNPVYGDLITDFSGNLDDSDPDINLVGYAGVGLDCDRFSNIVKYESYTFRPTVTGSYTFTRTSGSTKTIQIYDYEFFVGSPCFNLLDVSFTNGGAISSSITLNLTAGDQYVLLVNSFTGGNGAYTISYSGPGNLFNGNIAPPGNYSYAYVVVDTSTNLVESIVDDPDLQGFMGGCYNVYGLSYENIAHSTSALNTSYAGNSFNDFQDDLFDGSVCGDLSDNQKLVCILDCEAEAGAVSPPTAVNGYAGGAILNLNLVPDYSGVSMPGAGFGYTYVIVDAGDLSILAFSDGADLSSAANFPAGEYLVYGFSYDQNGGMTTTTDLSNAYVGQNLGFLQNQINTQVLCADLSSNRIEVNILTCEPNGAVFTPDGSMTLPINDPGLALSLSPSYGTLINNFSGFLDDNDPQTLVALLNGGSGCISGNSPYYEQFTFQVNASGSYTFEQTDGVTKVMALYNGAFNPADVCDNASFITSSGNFVGGTAFLNSTMTATLNSGVDYVLVVNTFSSSMLRWEDYIIDYSGPGQLFMGSAGPSSNYSYTFVVVNDLDGSIVQISDAPDLTMALMGDYTIYGLSYENQLMSLATLQATFVGNNFATLTAAITNTVFCGELSSNTKSLSIIDNSPVELLSFKAKNQAETVLLEWATSSESNNDGFYIERTADGTSWEKIGFVKGVGTTNLRQTYTFRDAVPLNGLSYYRLQQVDFDGTFTYSSVEAVDRANAISTIFQVFPNPGTGFYQLSADAQLLTQDNTRLVIRNQLGQTLKSFTGLNLTTGIDINELAGGIYFFSLETSKGRWSRRVVKR